MAREDASADQVLRAITDDGAFRVVAVNTTSTVRGAMDAQRALGVSAVGRKREVVRLFADLLTATVLVRETMAPDLRVQGILTAGDSVSRLVADARPAGATRGLMQLGKHATHFALGENARLQMMRSLHNGALQQGMVSLREASSVGDALMEYMRVSEQIVSYAAIGCLVDGDDVRAAGGYVVQLLPEVSHAPLAAMTERLEKFPHVDHLLAGEAADPASLLAEILHGIPYTRVGEGALRFECGCNEERVLASLATLPKADLIEMIEAREVLEIGCDYCGRQYRLAPDQLRGLVEVN